VVNEEKTEMFCLHVHDNEVKPSLECVIGYEYHSVNICIVCMLGLASGKRKIGKMGSNGML
jgi:hypothetical protein